MNSEGHNKQTHDKITVTSRSERKMCKLINPVPSYYTNERTKRMRGQVVAYYCRRYAQICQTNGSGIYRLCSEHVCFHVIKFAIFKCVFCLLWR
jgi:hypothetical protein